MSLYAAFKKFSRHSCIPIRWGGLLHLSLFSRRPCIPIKGGTAALIMASLYAAFIFFSRRPCIPIRGGGGGGGGLLHLYFTGVHLYFFPSVPVRRGIVRFLYNNSYFNYTGLHFKSFCSVLPVLAFSVWTLFSTSCTGIDFVSIYTKESILFKYYTYFLHCLDFAPSCRF